MVLVLFGDTHELHREVEVPAGDILICVGNFTMFSKSLSAIDKMCDREITLQSVVAVH